MPKYVCDFAAVNSIGEQMCQAASDLTTSVDTYSKTIENNLSSWEGAAKTAFTQTNTTQVTTAKKDAAYVNELGEFIKTAAKSIEDVETGLAGLSI